MKKNLHLYRERLAELTAEQLGSVAGGTEYTEGATCGLNCQINKLKTAVVVKTDPHSTHICVELG